MHIFILVLVSHHESILFSICWHLNLSQCILNAPCLLLYSKHFLKCNLCQHFPGHKALAWAKRNNLPSPAQYVKGAVFFLLLSIYHPQLSKMYRCAFCITHHWPSQRHDLKNTQVYSRSNCSTSKTELQRSTEIINETDKAQTLETPVLAHWGELPQIES